MVDSVEKWLGESPFARDLGVEWRDGALVLPFAEALTGNGTLHGGAIAALAVISAQAAMRTEDPSARAGTVSLQVDYVRGGRGSAFRTTPAELRRAHELGFYAVDLRNQDGVHIAHASATLANGGRGEVAEPAADSAADSAAGAPDSPEAAMFTTALQRLPFLADRGMRVVRAGQGSLEMALDPVERNLDGDGAIHEGAALTLLDVAGATVPWTLGRTAGSGATITLTAHFLGPLPKGTLLARSAVRARDDRISWSEITILGADDSRPHAIGTVVYRFA